MQFSHNLIFADNYPEAGEHVIYQTRTQGMVKINRELKDLIEHYEIRPDALKKKYENDINILHDMGFVVKDEAEDQQKLKDFMQQLKFGVEESCYTATILTTYACNFKCTYCFEESSRTNVKMDWETCEHTMNWLKDKITAFGYRKLFITFYGGEPLLNKPVLEHIAETMKSWCESRGVEFKFMLQTNGYLMTPECVDKYLTLGLSQVRISVDGVGGDHDRFRPLRGGGPTFETIIKNIAVSCGKVKIGISVAYDKGDLTAIEKLLEYFDEMGILHKLGRFIYSPIHATLGPKGNKEHIVNSSCMCNYEDDSLVDTNDRLQAMMKAKGLSMRNGLSTSVCPVTRDNSGLTIDQHGRLYKCNSMLGHPELSTGNVRDNGYNEQHREFINLDVWKQCPQDCKYLPMCSGSCRLSSFLKYKNFKTPSCHKNYLNKMTPEFVKKEYAQLVSQKMHTVNA